MDRGLKHDIERARRLRLRAQQVVCRATDALAIRRTWCHRTDVRDDDASSHLPTPEADAEALAEELRFRRLEYTEAFELLRNLAAYVGRPGLGHLAAFAEAGFPDLDLQFAWSPLPPP